MEDAITAAYHYSALNTSKKEIRLLALLPGGWTEPLRCELKTFSLIERPFYCALSYVWGDPKATKPILLHDHSVQVTTNLEAALRRLRHGTGIIILWVDALCIDQRNDIEKGSQVAMMNQIYARCDHSLIWLGDRLVPHYDEEKGHPLTIHELALKPWMSEQPMIVGETNFDELIWGLGELHATFMIVYLLSKNRHLNEYPWYQKSPEMDAAIEALQAMTSAWWWSRAWTVQETVLPARAMVIWGPYQAHWEMFAAASRNLHRHVNSCCEADWAHMATDRNKSRLMHFASTVAEFEQIRKQRLAVYERALAEFMAKLNNGEVSLTDCLDSSSEDPRLNIPVVELRRESSELLKGLIISAGLPSLFQEPSPKMSIREPLECARSAGSLSKPTEGPISPSPIEDLIPSVLARELAEESRLNESLSSSSGDPRVDSPIEERLRDLNLPPNQRMWTLQILPKNGKDRELSTMPQILWAFRNRDATNPRDKIYALGSLITRWHGGQPLTPDYRLSVLEVWAQAIAECLKLNDLSILMGTRSQDPQLASWVPAWNQWTEDGGTGMNTNDTDTAEKQHETYRYYTASADKPISDFSLNRNVLSLSAIHLDKISTVGIVQPAQSRDQRSTIYALQQWQLMIDLHLQHDQPYAHNSFTKNQAFWHTVTRDMFLDDKHTRRLNASTDAVSGQTFIELTFFGIVLGTLSESDPTHRLLAGKATSILYAMTYKSRFFVTEAGFFGLANAEIRAGDDLHLLIGSNVPSVTRGVSEPRETKNTCQLVSDCYVHGIMDGEVIDTLWDARETINIV